MRHSSLAHVFIRIPIEGRVHLLLCRNKKWDDWNLVGGHVESGEEGDWARTALRECEEELAPLKYGTDFILVPLLRQPVSWGPVPSKSVQGTPTRYTAQFFALEFRRDPAECLAKLPADEFALAAEAQLRTYAKHLVSGAIEVARRKLPGGLRDVPVSWEKSIKRRRVHFGEPGLAQAATDNAAPTAPRRHRPVRRGAAV